MSSLVFARSLESALDPAEHEKLQAIDKAYAKAMQLEPQLSRSSLSFYSRTGHAFIAMQKNELQEDALQGFVLAQSIWNGTRPTVIVNYLAVADMDDIAAREALLEAVTKSAYDAAVYDIHISIPEADSVCMQALERKAYQPVANKIFARKLGSRGHTHQIDPSEQSSS